jgi:putative copper export protein
MIAMTKRTRRLFWLAAAVCAVLAVLMFLVSAGKGLAAPVSNCNRDCDDGTSAMYAACVFGGLFIVATVVAVLGRPPRSAPAPVQLPEARARPK